MPRQAAPPNTIGKPRTTDPEAFSETCHLNECGNRRSKCSSSWKLVTRFFPPFLWVAGAVLLTVLAFCITRDMCTRRRAQGQPLAPSLGEVNDVTSGASRREKEEQPTTPGAEMLGRSEFSEQQQSLGLITFSNSSTYRRDKPEESKPVRLGRPQTITVGEQAGESQENIEAVEAKSGELTQQGVEAAQLEEREPALLPQCYSSPAADPSEGSWKKVDGGVEMSPVNPEYIGRGSMCADRWAKEHREGDGPQPYWNWEPSACTLQEVDASKFCQVMKGRKGLLLVGDSLSEIMTQTLAGVLRADAVSRVGFIHNFSACGGELKFAWYRNDLLDVRRTEFESIHCALKDVSDTRCTVFATDSVLEQFDTLVVNAGAHSLAGGMSAFREMMMAAGADLTSSMDRLHDNAVTVVRNTVPGHWECHDRMFDGPVDLDVATTLIKKGPAEFQWTSIVEKNKILEEAFPGDDGWTLLDAYTPTVLRADSHRGAKSKRSLDCLHYCNPGPVDHWVILLYNMLLVETAGREQQQ